MKVQKSLNVSYYFKGIRFGVSTFNFAGNTTPCVSQTLWTTSSKKFLGRALKVQSQKRLKSAIINNY